MASLLVLVMSVSIVIAKKKSDTIDDVLDAFGDFEGNDLGEMYFYGHSWNVCD